MIMNKKQIWFVIIFNLFIALSFYFENYGVGHTELSSDSLNAIPVCYKIDNPSLFEKDLYLNDLKNVRYYTPFYIETVRFFAKIQAGDYLKGLNLLATILHLLYGLIWFYAFYLYLNKDFWISFLLSVLVRGIVWLPGLEIWGISDLWTIMPRTVYITFLPIPFILLFYKEKIKYFFISCFTIGILFNFHPITGIGGILLFVGTVFGFLFFNKNYFKIKPLLIGFITMVVGMIPFLLTYFTKTDATVAYNLEEYNLAFNARIPIFFTDIKLYILQWAKPKTLFFVLPIIGLFILSIFKKEFKKIFWITFVALIFVFVFPVLSILVEKFINNTFNKNLRMSFQLVRAQKTMVVLGLFALGVLLIDFFKKYSQSFKCYFVVVLVSLIALSKLSIFDNVPLIGDDISRTVFPNYSNVFKNPNEKLKPLDKLSAYVKENTPKDALFADFFIFRSAAERSVILDGKGASMLIEGNPVQFIEWYKDVIELKECKNYEDSIRFYKNKNVNYLIFRKKRSKEDIKLIHQEGSFFLYEIIYN